MKHFPRITAWLLGLLSCAAVSQAQNLPQLENDYRNVFSLQPSVWPPPAPNLDEDPRPLTPGQWQNGSTLGGWQTTRILSPSGGVLAGAIETVAGPATLKLPKFQPVNAQGVPVAGQGVSFRSSVIGSSIATRVPTVFYGEPIPRPSVDENGMPVDPMNTFFPEPVNSEDGLFYYSGHARTVFATQPGVILITWKFRDPNHVPKTLTLNYTVSNSPLPSREVKRMFWTERGFTGPTVRIPEGPISAVKARFQTQFPDHVSQEYVSPYQYAGDPAASAAPELRTFWFSPTDRSLHAFNKEGRVFVEFLGPENRETGLRQFLGTEVVEVIRELTPAHLTVAVGNRILPHDQDESLEGHVVSGLSGTVSYVHLHAIPSKSEVNYYAIRTTTPTNPVGLATGEITFYWLRRGALNLSWPKYYDTYTCVWPADPADYTLYTRPDAATNEEAGTGVTLENENGPAIVFQDDPESQQSVMVDGNKFYTKLTVTDPDGRTLIRHSNGEELWFERIYSKLDTTFPSYNALENAVVGARLEAPAGYEPMVGYIQQPTGTAFDPTAYLDPFVVGFDAAKAGAIIPVNAVEDQNELEVWWFKKSSPPAGTQLKPSYWPAAVRRYTLAWPANPPEIVLASNAGTMDLPSDQAAGRIYVQNSRRAAGFNPNEEHAIMAAGRAWAIRDDLNLPTTSEPFVLVRYQAAEDARPAIQVFKVLREKPAEGKLFTYNADAGKILQAPMPLPILPLPIVNKKVKNLEIMVTNNDPYQFTGAPAHYGRYTIEDRKGTHWVYRGPHTATGEAEFRMRYYYQMMDGFYVPNPETEIAVGADAVDEAQPAPGSILPYLRPYANGVDAADGFLGAATTAEPQDIVFHPVWPSSTPELRLGETLTLPKFGLPAVRGNTSVEVLYQQSVAKNDTPSARLFDPTRAKKFFLGKPGQLAKIPGSIHTSDYRGKTYFPNLPPHLSDRFYLDANEGSAGALVFFGMFNDEAFGEDYLSLNVLSKADLAAIKDLCAVSDADRAKWNTAIDGLETTMEIFQEDPQVLGAYIPVRPVDYTNDVWNYISGFAWAAERQVKIVKSKRVYNLQRRRFVWESAITYRRENYTRKPTFNEFRAGVRGGQLKATDLAPAWKWIQAKSTELSSWKLGSSAFGPNLGGRLEADFRKNQQLLIPLPRIHGPEALAEILDDDTAVDSYALSASGGGTGYVVLIAGNGEAFTPEDEPVSMHVLRVNNPLYRGEVKPIEPANPLAEKLTLQHTGDFAGHPEEYEFEWRYAPPVDGLSPVLYTFQRQLVMGDGAWTQRSANSPALSLSLPGPVQISNGPAQVGQPQSTLVRTFPLATLPFRMFLSLELGQNDAVTAYVNETKVAIHRVPGVADTATAAKPNAQFNSLPLLFEVPVGALQTGQNTVRLELTTTADPGTAPSSYLNARLESLAETENLSSWISVGVAPDEAPGVMPGSVNAKNRHVIQGPGIFTLTDNYFVMRYRAITSSNAAYVANGGWSKWTDPALAEGWIKRALRGINPFNQRVKDLYNNDINSDVSLVTQAGSRWEGDIALNLENIDNFGLIEIYETILRRGKALSIEGTPPIDYSPANDALLLASGYLNDLYQLLGNEAYADAANPTIAFNVDSQFGDVSTSLFAFKGQVASALDEELGLLRGRDDFLSPGVRTAPVYNRLVWNYTRGIDSGEAVYALNYNLKDLDADGVVGAKDAAKAYPQGHGDAYGHYLTALTGYYGLLWNEHFEWTPRVEAVNVLGKPVTVDYLDERKFASAAAAWTRTAAQVMDLTYRKSYDPAAEANPTWKHLKDGRVNQQTGSARPWGVDDWAARGGMGAYLHWLTSNSTLPAVDPNPNHEGIQKIDRGTVTELAEIVTQSELIQSALDTADARLNPLGLSAGAVPFDISPTAVDQGKTHYEQVYERASDALRNAAMAFNNAKQSTQFLRRQEESLAGQREAIQAQERVFTARLVDLYGTPYVDDIGPGKTYAQGYSGPDLLNFRYTDQPELFHNFTQAGPAGKPFVLSLSQAYAENDRNRPVFNMDANGDGKPDTKLFELKSLSDFVKPVSFVGRRAHPGRIQEGISELLSARVKLSNALTDYGDFEKDMNRSFAVYEATFDAHEEASKLMQEHSDAVRQLKGVLFQLQNAVDLAINIKADFKAVKEAVLEAMPKVVGLANDATAPARSGLKFSEAAAVAIAAAGVLGDKTLAYRKQLAIDIRTLTEPLELKKIAWKADNAKRLYDLKSTFNQLEDQSRSLDMALRAYDKAERALRTMTAEALRIQDEREVFRQKSAALIQGYRTKDFGFRAFRNEALESYKALFDLAGRYTFLAARAYDYETGLADAGGNNTANQFFQSIVKSRSLGVFADNRPQPAGSRGGDPGLSGVLAAMNSDWAVVKSRLGFNNPDRYRTTFSLRTEKQRIVNGAAGDGAWNDFLATSRMDNVLDDEDVQRYCMQINSGGALAVPGFVIPFQTTVAQGYNFFGQPLSGGDNLYSGSSFATKIRSNGISFKGYVGMSTPSSLGGSLSGTGATTPTDPYTGFADANALSATPYIYLVPTGADSMRAPALGDSSVVRSWQVEDQAIPLPFDIGGAMNAGSLFSQGNSLAEAFTIRKHQAFRAVPDGTVFSSAPGFTNARLIGRSVWNSRWKLVIPGSALLADPKQGMQIFQQTVKDIKLHLETYSYSGN